jgi:hypothetical protein
MKDNERYNTWIESKRKIEIRKSFANEVMSQIYQYERDKRKPLLNSQHLIKLISAHRFVKAGLVTAGAVTGLARIMFVIYTILAC